MNTILAWFITFNFVNIAWVFFRAIKVLKGMVGLSGVTLHSVFQKYSILTEYNVVFNNFWLKNIGGDAFTPLMLLGGLLSFKNSIEWIRVFSSNYKFLFFSICLFLFSLLAIKEMEFLYFDF